MADGGSAWQVVGPWGLAVLLGSFLAASMLIVLLRPVFMRFALAVPTARSSHYTLTPQWGGIAVVGATLGVTACALIFLPGLSGDAVARLGLVLGAALLLAAVGAVDDMRNLGVAPKLLGQAAAVAMVIAALPPDLRVLPELPVSIERALVFIGGIWFVNIVNFMDGIDWMLVAEVVPITLGVAVVGALSGLPPEALIVALALNGAMLGFAPFNRPVARLFLGDMGSLPIGLLTGWLLLLVASSGQRTAAVLLPLYFVADTTLTLLRRARAGERLWEAHRTHFYQRAGDAGLRTVEIVGRIFAVNLGLVALAVVSVIGGSIVVDVVTVLLGAVLVAWLLVSLARGRS
jgi:UDP-N-acetylmuramyl pentapeptide phosphotransferase/UDP-N-acetylglucosamine-1-phosphate transferase